MKVYAVRNKDNPDIYYKSNTYAHTSYGTPAIYSKVGPAKGLATRIVRDRVQAINNWDSRKMFATTLLTQPRPEPVNVEVVEFELTGGKIMI